MLYSARALLPPLTREPPKLGKLVSGNPAAVPLPPGGRLMLVCLGRAINDRPYYSPCGAGFHREAISSTAGGYHPSAAFRRQDIIAWAAKPTPGRGFEEVYERTGHKPKSALHKRRAKTPLRRTKQGMTMFALPSEGSNLFCLGSFWGRGGLFSKSPPQIPSSEKRNEGRGEGKNRKKRGGRECGYCL